MRLPVVFAPRARADMDELADLLGRFDESASSRFAEALHRAVELIGEMPGGGQLYEPEDPTMPAMRKWPIRGFRKYKVHRVLPR